MTTDQPHFNNVLEVAVVWYELVLLQHLQPSTDLASGRLACTHRIQFKIAISAFDCVREHCPAYFNYVCIPVAGISGRANLHSAEHHDMLVASTRPQLGRQFPHCSSSRLEAPVCYINPLCCSRECYLSGRNG